MTCTLVGRTVEQLESVFDVAGKPVIVITVAAIVIAGHVVEEKAKLQVFSPDHGIVQQRNLHIWVIVPMRRIDGGVGRLGPKCNDDGQDSKEQDAYSD